jgi:4-hydroxy-3-methylbut-2-enyl diphosphate reductase
MVIVVGSPTSSNSNRLRELARKLGTESLHGGQRRRAAAEWFDGKQRVGLTAGASAPDILVQQVIERIKALGAVSVRKMQGIEETVKFPLPKGLKLSRPRPSAPACAPGRRGGGDRRGLFRSL